MYPNRSPRPQRVIASLLCLATLSIHQACGPRALAQAPTSVIRNISNANERLEMTVNTSQVLTLGTRIPRLVVNNPELVTATPISETQVQIAARKPGVTQINLWDEKGQVFTVDLLIFGDVRELELTLKNMFPASALRIRRLSNSLVLEGQVDRPEVVSTIRSLAEDYAPKVINNITVGGVQQVALKVKVMEVSRTKLRKLGFDFALFDGGDFVASSASDILQSFSNTTSSVTAAGSTIDFGIVDGTTSFFGVLEALQQNNVSKILADPTITTVSGRPAHFNVGGELPILVPSGLGQVGIEYKEFGTQVDFVPIVLGNGRIRLEVRPRVSEIDDSRSVTINNFVVPALKVRQVDCGVEMNAGQTLALAGLIQERVEASHRGLPFLSSLPAIGAAFRRVEEQVNEIELLILVTPEFVDAMDPHEVPPCGPGMETMSPSHSELYCKGFIEVPACGPCGAPGCVGGQCGAGGRFESNASWSGATVVPGSGQPMPPTYAPATVSEGDLGNLPQTEPYGVAPTIEEGGQVVPALPSPPQPSAPPAEGPATLEGLPSPSTGHHPGFWNRGEAAGALQGGVTGPQGPPWRPNPNYPTNPQVRIARPAGNPTTSTPGLIGPIGYDVQK
jgi:pilus assembly protein CpaC